MVAFTFGVWGAQPEPQAAQDGLGVAIAVDEGRVYLGVAALQEDANRGGAGGRVHAVPHLHGAQHRGGPDPRLQRGHDGSRSSGGDRRQAAPK